jgi:hypothetical protein
MTFSSQPHLAQEYLHRQEHVLNRRAERHRAAHHDGATGTPPSTAAQPTLAAPGTERVLATEASVRLASQTEIAERPGCFSLATTSVVEPKSPNPQIGRT